MRSILLFSFIFNLTFIINSCQKEISYDIPPTRQDSIPPSGQDSINLILRIQQPYEWSNSFNYDDRNRLISYGRYTSNFDTTAIIYNNSNKPISVVRYTRDAFAPHYVTPSIFVYNSEKISKIILKRKMAAGTYTQEYLTTIGSNSEIRGYDSLCYNSKNQIVKSFFFEVNSSIPDTTLWEYKEISYMPQNDSLLKRIESFYRDNNNNFPLSYSLTCNTFDNKRNPFYNLVPMYPYLNPSGKTQYWPLPYIYSGSSGSNNFLSLSPNNSLTNSISFNITYTYNSDSLPVTSLIGGNGLETVNYIYKKVKK
jgi:hypothetical protein